MAKKIQGLSALPLGGVGEIGMNMMVYECDGSMILVDVGVSFPDHFAPGTDLVLPDISYVRDNIKKLKAIFITHAHEDHVGALPYLWDDMPVPVYATPFTSSVIEHKKRDLGLGKEFKLKTVDMGDTIEVGPFTVEYVPVTHSVPEASSLFIKTPHGNIVHTGDYRFDDRPVFGGKSAEARFKEIGEEGVLAMFGDSTNIFTEGALKTESDVADSLDSLLGGMKNRVYFCTFASNFGRVLKMADIAMNHGRKVCLMGRSMHRMLECVRESGLIDQKTVNMFVSSEEASAMPDHKVLVILTGTQGESRAALNRMSGGQTVGGMTMKPKDVVIMSSKMIPGNERPILNMMNRLTKLGARVIHEKSDFVHCSGHGSQKDIAKMYNLVRPQVAIPVHGEYQHLKAHAEFAKKCGVFEQFIIMNGQKIILGPDQPEVDKTEYRYGRNYVDGMNILDDDVFIVAERRRMAQEGILSLSLVVDKEDGKVISGPHLKSKGLIDERLQDDLIDQAENEVLDILSKRLSRADMTNAKQVEDVMSSSVRRTFMRERGKKPTVIPQVILV
ncbi:MAG: ribonuclease J [Alphaproteobacteria bacterium]|nr:ribonuclease J [Alphaproteobacteria bacterium]